MSMSMSKIISLALVAPIFFLGACSGDSASEPAKPAETVTETVDPTPTTSENSVSDEAFIATVHYFVPSLSNANDEELINLGHETCDYFEKFGASNDNAMTLATAMVDEAGITYDEAGGFMGAATAAYCPTISDSLFNGSSF